MNFKPLSREEMKSAISGKGSPHRVPMMIHFWTSPETFGDKESMARDLLDRYPNDAQRIYFHIPNVFDAPADDPEYRWVNYDDPQKDTQTGYDEKVAIEDWSQMEGILKEFPSPEYSGLFTENHAEDGRYRLGFWWFCLFERHWSLRGMTNALMDFYDDPDNVHRLYRALTDFYLRIMERGKKEQNMDGIMFSDDLGAQTGPFFSHAIFKEFFKPYYKELIDKAHSLGMHVWLHCCGNIEVLLPDFIEIGLDVIHPIQKYTMEEKKIAEKFGKDICIWAGFDVQRTIPYGTPAEVREEVRFMIDTYARKEGRLIMTAGNAISPDCKIESLEALLDETYYYGSGLFSNHVDK